METNNRGRKIGSNNKVNPKTKEALLNILEPDLKRLNRLLNSTDHQTRVSDIKYLAKILTSGNDDIATKTRELLYSGLEEHFRKLRFYIPLISQEKKVSELRQFLKLLDSKRIEEVLVDMNTRQKIKF